MLNYDFFCNLQNISTNQASFRNESQDLFQHPNKFIIFAIGRFAGVLCQTHGKSARLEMRHLKKQFASSAAKAMLAAAVLLGATCTMNIQTRAATQRSTVQKYKELTFQKTVHDFGTFSEASGPKTCTFTYKNETDIPIFIREVVTGCGCTTTEWSGKPVKPGESGKIKVTYSNDLGSFIMDKSITVYVSSRVKPTILRIKGIVTKAE